MTCVRQSLHKKFAICQVPIFIYCLYGCMTVSCGWIVSLGLWLCMRKRKTERDRQRNKAANSNVSSIMYFDLHLIIIIFNIIRFLCHGGKESKVKKNRSKEENDCLSLTEREESREIMKWNTKPCKSTWTHCWSLLSHRFPFSSLFQKGTLSHTPK